MCLLILFKSLKYFQHQKKRKELIDLNFSVCYYCVTPHLPPILFVTCCCFRVSFTSKFNNILRIPITKKVLDFTVALAPAFGDSLRILLVYFNEIIGQICILFLKNMNFFSNLDDALKSANAGAVNERNEKWNWKLF